MSIMDRSPNRLSGILRIMSKKKVWKRRKIKKTNWLVKVFWLLQVRGPSLKEAVRNSQVRRQLDQQMGVSTSHNRRKGHWLMIRNRLLTNRKINKIRMMLLRKNQRNQSNLNHQRRKKKSQLKMIKPRRNQVNQRSRIFQKNQRKIKTQLRSNQKMKKKKKKRLRFHLKHLRKKKRNQWIWSHYLVVFSVKK